MPGFTPHYQLETLDQGETFALNGQKYTTTDRATIDRLLYAGAEGHHHSGSGLVQNNPGSGPALTLGASSGGLPSSTRVYYVYTWVDAAGFETAPSPESFVDTPPAVLSPAAPLAVASGSGGGLIGSAGYFYALSAYTGISSAETGPGPSVFVTTPASGSSSVTLTYPVPPSGATGFNIYRRAPGDGGLYFLAAVALNVATPPTTFIDDAGIAETHGRVPTYTNTTNSTNHVTVTIPGAPPVVPAGFTWNVYRSFTSNSYLNALVASVVPVLGVEPTTIVDTGGSLGSLSPPLSTQLVGAPAKVNLATEVVGQIDLATQVHGVLPAALGAHPVVVTFRFAGSTAVQSGKEVWVCQFNTATIVAARVSLGRGSHPASTAVVCDVLKGSGATPMYVSIFAAATPSYPSVGVGKQVGLSQAPTITSLVAGDTLSPDILHAGGGATPTDHDVVINVLLVVSGVGLP